MIEYEIERRKIKNVYICIKNGKIVVKAPIRISKSKIDELVTQKREWIEKKIKNKKEDRLVDIKNKKYVYILGNKVNIKVSYIEKRSINVKLDRNSCFVYLPKETIFNDEIYSIINKKIDKELKEFSKYYIMLAMEKYIKLTSLQPKEIVIRKFKSIWGNCSSKKVIKINQNIIHYGMDQIEYVCLHELTHLKYMNHQKEFWNYIKKYMPNYKNISDVLKQ
ncbi:MAG: M48 family metallopeptidase [Clostridia bacterium]